MIKSVMPFIIITVLPLTVCSGGFGGDSGEADELGPVIFGKDTAR